MSNTEYNSTSDKELIKIMATIWDSIEYELSFGTQNIDKVKHKSMKECFELITGKNFEKELKRNFHTNSK